MEIQYRPDLMYLTLNCHAAIVITGQDKDKYGLQECYKTVHSMII